jgi:hypothetical protein
MYATHCDHAGHPLPRQIGTDRIGAARFVSVTARRRTQIRRFWRDRYWADVGGEVLLLVAAVMI